MQSRGMTDESNAKQSTHMVNLPHRNARLYKFNVRKGLWVSLYQTPPEFSLSNWWFQMQQLRLYINMMLSLYLSSHQPVSVPSFIQPYDTSSRLLWNILAARRLTKSAPHQLQRKDCSLGSKYTDQCPNTLANGTMSLFGRHLIKIAWRCAHECQPLGEYKLQNRVRSLLD